MCASIKPRKRGGINIVLIILSFFLIYFLSEHICITKKINLIQKNLNLKSKSHSIILNKLNNNKYLKVFEIYSSIRKNQKTIIISSFIGILSLINYHSLLACSCYFLISYIIQILIINIIKKNKNNKISYEMYNITNNLILELDSNINLRDSLKSSIDVIEDKNLKNDFEILVSEYELYNLNISKAIKNLEDKHDNYDVAIFSDILKQYGKGESIIQNLENLLDMLRKKYMNYLRKQTTTKIIYISLGLVLSLANILMIVIYPVAIELLNNLNKIFS